MASDLGDVCPLAVPRPVALLELRLEELVLGLELSGLGLEFQHFFALLRLSLGEPSVAWRTVVLGAAAVTPPGAGSIGTFAFVKLGHLLLVLFVVVVERVLLRHLGEGKLELRVERRDWVLTSPGLASVGRHLATVRELAPDKGPHARGADTQRLPEAADEGVLGNHTDERHADA